MNDTSPEMESLVTVRYKLLTPDQRMNIASSMFETARAIVESSLPLNLTPPRAPPCVRQKVVRRRAARCSAAGVRRVEMADIS